MTQNGVISLVLALKQWFCIALTHVDEVQTEIWDDLTDSCCDVCRPTKHQKWRWWCFTHAFTYVGLQTPNFMYPRSLSYSVALQWIYKIKIIACCPPHMYVTLLPIRPCRPKCLLFLSSPLAIDRLTVLCCLFCWLSPYLIDVFYSPHVSQACNHIKQPIIHKTVHIYLEGGRKGPYIFR